MTNLHRLEQYLVHSRCSVNIELIQDLSLEPIPIWFMCHSSSEVTLVKVSKDLLIAPMPSSQPPPDLICQGHSTLSSPTVLKLASCVLQKFRLFWIPSDLKAGSFTTSSSSQPINLGEPPKLLPVSLYSVLCFSMPAIYDGCPVYISNPTSSLFLQYVS